MVALLRSFPLGTEPPPFDKFDTSFVFAIDSAALEWNLQVNAFALHLGLYNPITRMPQCSTMCSGMRQSTARATNRTAATSLRHPRDIKIHSTAHPGGCPHHRGSHRRVVGPTSCACILMPIQTPLNGPSPWTSSRGRTTVDASVISSRALPTIQLKNECTLDTMKKEDAEETWLVGDESSSSLSVGRLGSLGALQRDS